jgi:hypothetical protein
MRFRLRTLVTLVALLPPLIAVMWITSVSIARRFWDVDREYNFARPLTETEQAELNKIIDLAQESEKDRLTEDDWRKLQRVGSRHAQRRNDSPPAGPN